jgi:hypothetical protein
VKRSWPSLMYYSGICIEGLSKSSETSFTTYSFPKHTPLAYGAGALLFAPTCSIRVHLLKAINAQLAKIFPGFHETRIFITVQIRARLIPSLFHSVGRCILHRPTVGTAPSLNHCGMGTGVLRLLK